MEQNIKAWRSAAAITVITLALGGCVVIDSDGTHFNTDSWEREQRENREAIAALDIGMERSQALSGLDAPAYSEAFTRDGDDYRILFFRTQRAHADGDTTKDETTPLVFKNDVLIGWGREAYNELQ